MRMGFELPEGYEGAEGNFHAVGGVFGMWSATKAGCTPSLPAALLRANGSPVKKHDASARDLTSGFDHQAPEPPRSRSSPSARDLRQSRGLENAKEADLLGNLISVAHAGGQGKTTLAQLLYIWGKQAGGHFRLAAADFLDESGRSKIGSPNKVLEFGTGANLTAVRSENNMNASVRSGTSLAISF